MFRGFFTLGVSCRVIVVLGLLASLLAGAVLPLWELPQEQLVAGLLLGGLCMFVLVALVIGSVLSELAERKRPDFQTPVADPASDFSSDLEEVRDIAEKDPQRVARILKNWIAADA